jgi:hypothetical protein
MEDLMATTELEPDTTDADEPLALDRIAAHARQLAAQSGGGYNAAQLTLANVLRILAEAKIAKLTDSQIISAMRELKDIPDGTLFLGVRLFASNYRRVADLSYFGITRFIRQAAVLGPQGIAKFHRKLERPKLNDLRSRAKLRNARERRLDGHRLAAALYQRRKRFQGWERDLIEAAAAMPDGAYFSTDQHAKLVALAKTVGLDLMKLEEAAE